MHRRRLHRRRLAAAARGLHPYHGMSFLRRLLPGLRPCLLPATALSLAVAPFFAPVGAPLGAQGVRGVVVTGDSVPVRGAVVSLLDSLGTDVVSSLTDEFGRFDLRAPRRGTWRLRAEAVGFARVTSFNFELATAEVLVRRVQLTDATAALRGIEVRERQQCDIRPAEGTQVALLWDEARKSLAAAALSAERAPPVAFDLDEIEYDSTFMRVRAASRITSTGRAERGFRSDLPRALRELGYARRIDTTSIYFAPDARALLSDDFAATHCFRIVPDDPTSVRRVGIGFSPVGLAPGKLDVVGTIWIDRETFALDRVEFRYEPLLSADFADTTFGGRVRFARLPTGHLVVSHWVLRMPIFAESDDGRLARAGQTSQLLVRAERRESVIGIKVARGAARAFDAPPEPLPTVNAMPRRAAGAPSCSGVAPVAGNSGALVGDVHDGRDRGQSGARVRASWHQPVMSGGRMVFREQWVESGADAAGRYALCALPRAVTLSVSARTASAGSVRTRVVLESSGALPSLEITVAAARRDAPAPRSGVVAGRVLGAQGGAIVGAEIRVFPGSMRLATDSTGSFLIPDAAPGSREFFVRRLGFAPLMVAVDVSAGDTASVVVQMSAAAQVMTPVTIEARATSLSLAGFELRREQRIGSGTFITPDEIRARENGSLQTLLRTFARVRVEESAATGDIRVYGRGGDNPSEFVADRCSMRIVVDGAVMPDGMSLTGLPPLREIAAIEIYQSIGAAPAMYSFSTPECGLIVIWTRDGVSP